MALSLSTHDGVLQVHYAEICKEMNVLSSPLLNYLNHKINALISETRQNAIHKFNLPQSRKYFVLRHFFLGSSQEKTFGRDLFLVKLSTFGLKIC